MRTPTNTTQKHIHKRSAKVHKRSNNPVGTSLRPEHKHVRGIPLKRTPNLYSAPLFTPKTLAVLCGLLTVILVIVLVRGFSLVSCSSKIFLSENPKTLKDDRRIEPGTQVDIAQQLAPILDRNDKFAWIAAHTSKYNDPRIIELAIREPSAIDFVYQWPSAPKKSKPYTGKVAKGAAPLFYCWDEHWGNVIYSGVPLAVSGSGPYVMAMAYMGLTGKTDKTPETMARLATEKGYVSEKGETSPDFFKKAASLVSLECTPTDGASSSINSALSERKFVIAHVKDDKDTGSAHWILIADHQQNGAVRMYDPTSTTNSTHEWDTSTIKDMCDEMYIVHVAQGKK